MKRDYNLSSNAFYHLLKTYMENMGYTPTIRELGEFVGLNSPASVLYHLNKLERLGKIKRVNNRLIILEESEKDDTKR